MNFLDVSILLDVQNNSLKFRFYKKSTYIGRLINYHSNTPFHFKWNNFTNILKRWLYTSDPVFHEELILEFKDLMKKNYYDGKYLDFILECFSEEF